MHLCIRTKESTHQLTAADFLSVQKLPLRLSTSMSGNVSCTNSSATSVPCRQIEMVKSTATAAQHLRSLTLGFNPLIVLGLVLYETWEMPNWL